MTGDQGGKGPVLDDALVALEQAARDYRSDEGYEDALRLRTLLVDLVARGPRSEALVDGCRHAAQSMEERFDHRRGRTLGYGDLLLYSSLVWIAERLSAKMLVPTVLCAVKLAADGDHRHAWDLVLAVLGNLQAFRENVYQLPTDFLILIAKHLATAHCLYDFPDYETEEGAALDVLRAMPNTVRREFTASILLAAGEEHPTFAVSPVLLAPLLVAYAFEVEAPASIKLATAARTTTAIAATGDMDLYHALCVHYIDLLINGDVLGDDLEIFEASCRELVGLLRPLNKDSRIELLGQLVGHLHISASLAYQLRDLLIVLIGTRGIWAVSQDQDLAFECAVWLLDVSGDDGTDLAASTGHRIMSHLSFQAGDEEGLAKHFDLARSSAPDPASVEREFAGVAGDAEPLDDPALSLSVRLAHTSLRAERQLETGDFVAALETVRGGLLLEPSPGDPKAPISRRRLMALGAAAAQRAGDLRAALDFVLVAIQELTADAAAASLGASRHERRRAFGQVESLASAGLRMVAQLTSEASSGGDGDEADDISRGLDAIWGSLIRFRDADGLFLMAARSSGSSSSLTGYREARRRLDHLELEGDPSWLDIDTLRTARLATDAAEREAIMSPEFVSTLKRRLGVELDEVRSCLPDGAALIDFVDLETGVTTDEGAVYTHAILIALAESTLVAFDRRFPLAKGDGFAHYVGKRRGVFSEPDLESLGATLHAIALDNGLTTLFVVLDATMATLRVAALPLPDGGHLSDIVTLVHLGSPADLLPPSEASADEHRLRAEVTGESSRMALVGAPNFDTSNLDGVGLPAAEIELGVVAARWTGVTTVLRGADVTVRHIGKIRAPAVLHVATHGFVHEGALTSDLRSTPAELLELYRAPRLSTERPMDPGLRAGLALVDFRSWTASREPSSEPSVLTPSDMAWMDLRGTRVVVFSACRTALRTSMERAGALDFRAAAQAAGAQAVIAPLHDVSDLAAALLMAFLYEVAPGPPGPEALRAASHRLRDLTIHDLLAYTAENPAFAKHPLLAEYSMWESAAKPFSSPRYWATFVYYLC